MMYGCESSDYDKKHNFIISGKCIYFNNILEIVINNEKIINDPRKWYFFEKYEDYIKNNINQISYIKYERMDIFELWFENGLLHSINDAAYIKDTFKMTHNKDKIYSYFYKGTEYTYDDWLMLPEKVRELRNSKLELL